jgi:urease accessory protein
MEVFSAILGAADAPEHHEALHRLSHAHAVDVLRLPRADLARRRLRTMTEGGRAVAIALPRSQTLFDGALLELTGNSALVVRVETERWLRLAPRDPAAALRVGYACGNLHWRVRFEGDHLLVALEGEEGLYLDRLAPILEAGDVTVASGEAGAA